MSDLLSRLRKLESECDSRKAELIHAIIDGEDKRMDFDEAFSIAVNDDFLRSHEVKFIDEAIGTNLLSALADGFYLDPSEANWN